MAFYDCLFRSPTINFPTFDMGSDYEILKETASNIQRESLELMTYIEELKKDSHKLDKIYNVINECIVQVDSFGSIIEINEGLEQIGSHSILGNILLSVSLSVSDITLSIIEIAEKFS